MNVNDVVLAKLTKRGAFLLNDQNRELMFRFPGQKLRADYRSGDLYEQHFWIIVKHWGHLFHLNQEAPFTDIYPIQRDPDDQFPNPFPTEPVSLQND